jgi:hypothetical protein
VSNREIAEALGRQLGLMPVQTAKINGIPHRDAWLLAAHHPAKGDGIEHGLTAHVFAGQVHAYVEVLGAGQDAETLGRQLAGIMSRLRDGADTNPGSPGTTAGDAQDGRPAEGHTEQGQEQAGP